MAAPHSSRPVPPSGLAGGAGFLGVFGSDVVLGALPRALGRRFGTLNSGLKRYACHITAQRAVQAVQELRAEHGIGGDDVKAVTVVGEKRMAEVNNIPEPADVMMSQYSTPFCVALALYRDPRDPASFGENALSDPAIRSLCRRVTVRPEPGHTGHGDVPSTVTVTMKDGRQFTRCVEAFMGAPARPLDRSAMREKFLMLTRRQADAERMFERLQNIEEEDSLEWLGA